MNKARASISNTPSYWIGASEVGNNEGVWTWRDGSAVASFNWWTLRSGRPASKNANTRECVMGGYSPGFDQMSLVYDLYWYDVPCCIRLPYVCQAEKADTTALPA